MTLTPLNLLLSAKEGVREKDREILHSSKYW